MTSTVVSLKCNVNTNTNERQNDSEARRLYLPDGNVIKTRSYHFSSVREVY